MKILVQVDQRESLRRGVDAPSSTAKIEILPDKLPAEEREALASSLGPDGFRSNLRVPEPTLRGLKEALRERIASSC